MQRFTVKAQHGKKFVRDDMAPGLLLNTDEVCARMNAQQDQLATVTSQRDALLETLRGTLEYLSCLKPFMKGAQIDELAQETEALRAAIAAAEAVLK